MKSRWKLSVVALFSLVVCGQVFAYQLAMKNGSVVQFQRYRVENGSVICTDEAGKEVSVALADVDMERTKTLNAQETPPLDLSPAPAAGTKPAENAAAGQPTSAAAEPSLGDSARNLRQQGKAHPTSKKHSFTDDDVQSTGSGELRVVNAPGEKKGANGDPKTEGASQTEEKEEEVTEQDFSEYYDLDREQTARGIMNYAKLPPDTAFPDRADWEFRLYEAKQDMVHAYMHLKQHSEDEYAHEEFRQKWNQFARVANEGIGKARQYLRMHPQG